MMIYGTQLSNMNVCLFIGTVYCIVGTWFLQFTGGTGVQTTSLLLALALKISLISELNVFHTSQIHVCSTAAVSVYIPSTYIHIYIHTYVYVYTYMSYRYRQHATCILKDARDSFASCAPICMVCTVSLA